MKQFKIAKITARENYHFYSTSFVLIKRLVVLRSYQEILIAFRHDLAVILKSWYHNRQSSCWQCANRQPGKCSIMCEDSINLSIHVYHFMLLTRFCRHCIYMSQLFNCPSLSKSVICIGDRFNMWLFYVYMYIMESQHFQIHAVSWTFIYRQ